VIPLVVEDIFDITKLPGVMIVGKSEFAWVDVRIGRRVLLERPDGSNAEVRIGTIATSSPPRPDLISISLEGIERYDVPLGTKVFWTEEDFLS
jgi:hypothetical protein